MRTTHIASREWRNVLVFLGVVVTSVLLGAQAPPRGQPAQQSMGSGVIRGRVVRSDTGEPLRRVQVRVDEWSTSDPGAPALTMTDAEGKYELTELPAGRYHLTATRGGYVEVAYGQRRPFERGRPIDLRDGQVLEHVDFSLPAGAVVTGRIVDEAGEAVAHVLVSLVRRQFVEGARRLIQQSGSSTDDRGEFRIFGVAPGDYLIMARFDDSRFGARDRERYVPTYYPGSPSAAQAQPVTIGIGQEISGITMALARASTATVRGVVRGTDTLALSPFTFITAREVDAPHAYSQPAMALASADGAFALTGLLPGTYLVEARSASGGEFASAEVVVDSADVAGVSLTLSKGWAARGRIVFDTGAPPPGVRPSQVLILVSPLDQQGMVASGGPPVARDDWSFEVQGLRGRGVIAAATLSGWQMKAVRREGVDITDVPLDFRNGDVGALEIELTQRVTTVSGMVSDGRGSVSLDGTVIVFADDPEKWGRQTRFIESARPDQQGRFTIRGLPPGRYLAIAVDYLEPGEERDPELLESWRHAATSVTLSEGGTHSLDLQVSTF